MAKLEDDDEKKKNNKTIEAHVTSLSVLRTHRKLGIATKLMRAAHHQMKRVFNCDTCSLHVRVSNKAALTLYRDVLGYEVRDVDKQYYADKEDAYDMRVYFNKSAEEEKKASEETDPEGKGASDQYAESNPKKANQTAEQAEEEKAADGGSKTNKNKRKRDKKKAKAAGKEDGKEDE